MPSRPSEHSEQAGFVAWFRDTFPATLVFAIPNGEHRAISTAKRLKREGVTPGVPDLFVPAWRLWIEMKRGTGGRLSDDQKRMIGYLRRMGYAVIVAKGAEDASAQVLQFIKEKTAPKGG